MLFPRTLHGTYHVVRHVLRVTFCVSKALVRGPGSELKFCGDGRRTISLVCVLKLCNKGSFSLLCWNLRRYEHVLPAGGQARFVSTRLSRADPDVKSIVQLSWVVTQRKNHIEETCRFSQALSKCCFAELASFSQEISLPFSERNP